MNASYENCCIEQGTKDWLDLRKTKITATDASTILGLNPWKTKYQLYLEKTSDANFSPLNAAMQRGIDLEPRARLEYTLITGIHVEPKVIMKDWQMASVDGLSDDGFHLVEIKCPGVATHEIALNGEIPAYYYPQLQHQMHVCELSNMHYFSFDGKSGALVTVVRDQEFIDKMNIAEREFYECLLKKDPPELCEKDAISMEGNLDWAECANRYIRCQKAIQELEKEQEFLRNQLVFMARGRNCKGYGISLTKMEVKGSVDYTKIPEISSVDLDLYRKPPSTRWRITG